MASKKIVNDKYYTPSDLAEYCVNKTKEIIGEENITEWLEPSGGNGVFLDFLPQGTYSCDIEPEDERVTKQDYLELDLDYKKGRCVIGNPPFGERGNLVVQFYKKSIILGDYISFILPISQFKNTEKCFEFDLVYSENLGVREYSGIDVHCCFNLYKKPDDKFNTKNKNKLKDVEIFERIKNNNPKRNKEYDFSKGYDLRIIGWGDIGRELNKEDKQYAKEFVIKINNLNKKEEVLKLLKNANWKELYPMTKTPNLLHWQIHKYLKEQIPELE
ncbi:MAG: hypothetical protein ACRDD8_11520 [Bacteroidales bacterium]